MLRQPVARPRKNRKDKANVHDITVVNVYLVVSLSIEPNSLSYFCPCRFSEIQLKDRNLSPFL